MTEKTVIRMVGRNEDVATQGVATWNHEVRSVKPQPGETGWRHSQ
jgi:hypothetical protein